MGLTGGLSIAVEGGSVCKSYLIVFRLVVALAVVVFYTSSVFPYTGSGPLWKRISSEETDMCRRNWWLNILMVNNYVDTEHIVSPLSSQENFS